MLRKTVIGLIKNENEVDGVLADLHSAGIPQGSIKVLNRQELERHESEFQGDTDELRRSGLRGALRRMFGAEPEMDREEESPLYTDWIGGGGTLLAVDTDESHAGRVNQILTNYSTRERANRVRTEALRGETLPGESLRGEAFRDEGLREETLRAEPLRMLADEQTIPVIQEELHVGKRKIQRSSVRVVKHVSETPVEETINLRDETVRIERRPVDRIASEADIKEFANSRFELIETTEEPVVSKEAHVVEEIKISRKTVDHRETVKDSLKKTDVDIVDLEKGKQARRFYEASPAFEYGSALAADPRYRNRDWADVLPEARRNWEARGQGAWTEFAEAVREGWESFRNRRVA